MLLSFLLGFAAGIVSLLLVASLIKEWADRSRNKLHAEFLRGAEKLDELSRLSPDFEESEKDKHFTEMVKKMKEAKLIDEVFDED
tara:strand:- start:527 stop:781 length:255 start_codon:yes stop_codon:yes gene_type:complete